MITLLPDIREQLLSLKPQFLAELCTDPAAVAMKLVRCACLLSGRPGLMPTICCLLRTHPASMIVASYYCIFG